MNTLKKFCTDYGLVLKPVIYKDKHKIFKVKKRGYEIFKNDAKILTLEPMPNNDDGYKWAVTAEFVPSLDTIVYDGPFFAKTICKKILDFIHTEKLKLL